tara:strand:+ start:406 stop:651 length:246 start_codon:yes stop_codon:yes gene_type:complete
VKGLANINVYVLGTLYIWLCSAFLHIQAFTKEAWTDTICSLLISILNSLVFYADNNLSFTSIRQRKIYSGFNATCKQQIRV